MEKLSFKGTSKMGHSLVEKTTPVTQAIGIKSEEKTSERHNFMENIINQSVY
jgi:hypothetical protein